MPVSTMTRRAFFRGKSENAPAPLLNTKSKLGSATMLFPIPPQALPDVPPPAERITLLGGLTPYNGPWGYAQAAHLLRRTSFGLKKSDLDALIPLTMDSAVNTMLTVATNPPAPPVNNYNNPEFTDPVVPLGQTWINQPYELEAEGYRIESWRGWWYDRMLQQNTSILERMTLFWHNHFATQTEIVYWGRSVYEMNQLLRENALGNFKQLVKAVTTEGMMLVYLNGYLNTKGAPDENYARELQELFTIGKEGAQQYTEDDVVAAARVLTGWKINFPTNNNTYHYPVDHDFDNKQFSSFYNNTVIQGSVDGNAELDAMLDMIFERPEVAEFICRKLYRWFIYYNIDDNAEQNIIQPLATIFRANNYEIKPVLEALLKSEHFFEAAQTGCFIKTPVDIAIGTLRTFNVNIPDSTPWDEFVGRYYLSAYLGNMSMLPGDPPNVAGWQPFRQTPQYYRAWINGDTLRNRNLFTDILTAYYLETPNDQITIDLLAFAGQFSDPGNPVTLVEDITKLLFPLPLSATKKFLLKSILLSNLPLDSYWTAAWNAYVSNPNDPMVQEVVKSRLLAMHLYMTRLAEYQLA
jgi:uncharacterized protein (DUF1800 family)